MTVLVVAAHPDDEVLGCGGTIAKLSQKQEVHIAILGEGSTSRWDSRELSPKSKVAKLTSNAEEASKLLGASSIRFSNLPDNRFDELPLLDIIKVVERIISDLRPDIVYTHHIADLNIDHQITFRSVLTATRPSTDCEVKELYSFEIPSSTEWAFDKISGHFSPNVFTDISDSIDQKIKALNCYSEEVRKFPHPRSETALRSIAARWGSVCGLKSAEAFELIRTIN